MSYYKIVFLPVLLTKYRYHNIRTNDLSRAYSGKILFDVTESSCLPLENRKNHLLGPLYLSELYDMV